LAAPLVQPQKNPLDEERVEGLLKKWGDQIGRNEEDFKRQAKELFEYEAFIFEALDSIKYIEDTSSKVKDVYKNNA
jgi:hypothetical protein